MENSEVFATRLKELRGKITQGRLGEALGVSRGSVSFYENGERTPDADFLIKASRYFNVSTDYLLGLSEFKNQEVIDGLINRLKELDEFKTKEKSALLWSLGFVNERVKGYEISDDLREKIINWLVELLQDYANMIYLPAKIDKDPTIIITRSSPRRGAITIINKLDEAISDEQYERWVNNASKNKHKD